MGVRQSVAFQHMFDGLQQVIDAGNLTQDTAVDLFLSTPTAPAAAAGKMPRPAPAQLPEPPVPLTARAAQVVAPPRSICCCQQRLSLQQSY